MDVDDLLDAVTRHRNTGNDAFRRQEFIAALREYDLALEALQSAPQVQREEKAKLHNNKAQCFLNLKRWKEAGEEATLAIELDPTNIKAIIRRATALVEQGQLDDIDAASADLDLLKRIDSTMDLDKLEQKIAAKRRKREKSNTNGGRGNGSSSGARADVTGERAAAGGKHAKMYCEHGFDVCIGCRVDHRLGNVLIEPPVGEESDAYFQRMHEGLQLRIQAEKNFVFRLAAERGIPPDSMIPGSSTHQRLYDDMLRIYGTQLPWWPPLPPSRASNTTRPTTTAAPPPDSDFSFPEQFLAGSREPIPTSPLAAPSASARAGGTCAQCGGNGGGKLSKCASCHSCAYCSRECQRQAWATHREHCEALQAFRARTGVAVLRPCSWADIQSLGGGPAEGRLLEVRVGTQPMLNRWAFQAVDRKGETRQVACYADRPPQGLRLGAVMRWAHPRFHYFFDGSCGARIEDEDLDNIIVTPQ